MTTDSQERQSAPTSPAGDASEKNFGDIAASIGSRNLMIAIVTMPIFFLGLVAAIIMIFGRPQTRDGADTAIDRAQDAAAAEPSSQIPAPIMLTAGQTPGAIALDGDRLAVRLDSADGVVVVVYDLAQDEVIARVPFTIAEPD